jgi:hypothetical protein
MIKRILYSMIVAAIIGFFTTGCSKEEGILQITINDVSSRITGIPADVKRGAEMEITGTQLQNVQQIIFGLLVIRKIDMTITETSIIIRAPFTVALGENEIVLVFPGGDRAFTSINVTG